MEIIVSQSTNTDKFRLPDIIDHNRRPTLISYAASLRAYGAGEGKILEELLRANRERCQPPLSSYQDLKDLRRMAQWAGKKAVATRRRAIGTVDAQRLADARYALETHVWRGIAPQNAKRVAMAVLAKMERDHVADDCVADARSLAEDVSLSYGTVASALRKLCGVQKDGRILVLFSRQMNRTVKRVSDRDPVRYAFSYSIRLDSKKCKISTRYLLHKTTSLESTCANSALSLHDAFRLPGKGLTKSADLVYKSLPARTQEEVQEKTHISLRCIVTTMKVLVKENLIDKIDGLWVRTDKSLEDVAVKRGTAGAAQRQHDQHEHERKAYRGRLRERPGAKLKLVEKFGGTLPRRRTIPESQYQEFPDTIVEFSVPVRTGRFSGSKVDMSPDLRL